VALPRLYLKFGFPIKAKSWLISSRCGMCTGSLSYLFYRNGLKVYGIDLSEAGIQTAQSLYGLFGISFVVGDVRGIPLSVRFDLVFTRSCSLYNDKEFPHLQEITDGLLSYAKDNGTFVFVYNTKLSPIRKSKSWIYHSLIDVEKHFSRYPTVKIYAVNKVDTLLFGK